MSLRRFGHIGMTARDLESMVAFYCDVLGMEVSDRKQYPDDHEFTEGVWLRCGPGDHHAISMFGLRNPPAPSPGHTPLHHIAFEMESLDALKRARQVVRERGLELRDMQRGGPGVQLRLYFYDPEHNIVELYWDLDQIGWDGRARPWPDTESIEIDDIDEESWFEWKRSLT